MKIIEKIKDENDKLNKEINELKEVINNLEKELKEEKNKNIILKDSHEINNILNKNNESLYKIIIDKDEEIKILRAKLSRFPFELNEDERLMTIIFKTYDESLYYSIICKNTERFNIIENKLYDVYSEYSNQENFLIFNGKKINKVNTLEQNGIKNNSIITLIKK